MESTISTSTISTKELKAKLDSKEGITVVETLAPERYREAHIAGALNIPPGQIKELAPKLFAMRLALDNLTAFIHRYVWHMAQRNIQFVARVPALPFSDERAFLPQISKVTCRCRRGRTGDGAVLARAHATLEPFRPFLEHSNERFLLAVVQLSTD